MQSGSTDFWKYLFSPQSIAVIGASNSPGSWGNNAMKGLLGNKKRRVYPVNPNSPEVLNIKAYKSVTDVPDEVDLAVIVVSAELVPGVMRQCVSKGVRSAVVISAGFGETGEEGRKLEAETAQIARRGGLRFIGPNTMGHADTRTGLSTYGQTWKIPSGNTAVLAQSGNMCLKIVRNLMGAGVGFSKYISTGNEADLHMEDYLELLKDDDNTRVIAAYIEGLREGRRFLRLAKEITAHKPIVVVKAGSTEESARAVMSHTGALAGADEVYTAAFKQTGVIRVDDDDELCDVVYALVNCPLPRDNRVGILTIGGGPGALTAETCEKEGLRLGQLEESTIKRLDKFLPPRWSRRNPVDMAGPATSDFGAIADLLMALLEDANIDVVFLLAPIIMDRMLLTDRMGLNEAQIKAIRKKEEKNLEQIREKSVKYGKPVFLLWQSRDVSPDPTVSALFRKSKILVQGNARRAARILSHLSWYKRYLDATKDE
ncbi:MAG: CoA-binding protein [Dehalococcoidales bacterium]|nr:CoA-binding protein [Dehalococcoidales bacterium]